MVQAYSNLTMTAQLSQSSNEPGATLHVSAALREYDQPLTTAANVRAEVARPDGGMSVVTFDSVGGGVWETSLVAAHVGVYRIRIVAEGRTSRGRTFTRERLRTAAIWAGGDRPTRDPVETDNHVCEILECLLEQRGFSRLLERLEIDRSELLKCLARVCKDDRASEAESPGAILQHPQLAGAIQNAVRMVEKPR